LATELANWTHSILFWHGCIEKVVAFLVMQLVNSQRNVPKRDTATDERFPCGLQHVLLASCAAVAGVTLDMFVF